MGQPVNTTEVGLITHGGGVLDTDTGEVYPTIQDAPTPVLVRLLGKVQASIDDQLAMLYEAKRAVGAEVIERMDKGGVWTLHAQGVQLVAPSPTAGTVDWDAAMLDRILDELVEEGVIDREAKLRTVVQQITLKVDKRGVTALQKIPAVASRIEAARVVTEQGTRKVSVRVDRRAL